MQKNPRRHSHVPRRTEASALIGEHVTLDVTGVAHQGVFVSRLEGRVVFAPDTMPGERVTATITEDHGSFLRAVTDAVVVAAPARQAHIWPEAAIERPPAERAGGADFGHIRIDVQRELKAQVLRDALARTARLEPALWGGFTAVEAVGAGDVRDRGLGWRTRVGLHVSEQGVAGPQAARSHRVIPVGTLPLAAPELEGTDVHRREYPGAQRIDLVLPASGEPHILVDGAPDAVITQSALGIDFAVSASGFWQVHRDAADTLAQAMLQVLDESAHGFDPHAPNLDLYGGVGLFAGVLAEQCGARVTSVEADATAALRATDNLARWDGTEAVQAPTLAFLAEAARTEAVDYGGATIILDPPRAGAGTKVVDALVALRAAQLIYVACDPVSFARDAGTLARSGYRLHRLRAFDLYPNSHHLETLALFVRE